jgi:hypothetical protein
MRIIDLDTHIGPLDQWDYLPDEFRTMRPIQVFDRLGRTILVNPPRSQATRDRIEGKVRLSNLRKRQLMGTSIRRCA